MKGLGPFENNPFQPLQQRTNTWLRLGTLTGLGLLAASVGLAQEISPALYSGMEWRSVGPHRGGRVTAVAGIPGKPAIYYMGTPGGGVWKTTDGGVVWKPVFDAAHVASIGALVLAPSNPEIIYVGTGEQTEGKGVYRSQDGGATWAPMGLSDTKIITSVLVDPKSPDTVLVGSLGEFGVGSEARGVFRSTNGGKTWTKALYKDDRTGVVDMCFDPNDRRVVLAAMWHATFGFGPPPKKPEQDGWIYKSTDGGATWKPLPENGLPTESRGRIGVVIAPGTRGRRIFAIMNQGLFRSDDGGATWRQITKDPRVVGNFYFSRVFVDPQNANTVYVMQTSLYRSTDGGETFAAYKGAPGGDDYHTMWIDPENTQRIILGVDQGATISLDGGRSWTPWFNQATGQFYHVTTDNQFPYHVYAEQQDSGTVAVPNRSDYGEITYRDWFSVGGFEFGYIAPDPLHPNIVFTAGWYNTVVRFDKTTGGIHFVFIPGEKHRSANEAPLQFSPVQPDTLYYATQYVLKTTDGGTSWQTISPDLTEVPAKTSEKKDEAAGGTPPPPPRGVITALGPSPHSAGVLWAGTSTGQIQLTRDGGADWKNVSPADLPARARVLILEASRRDSAVAYAAIAALRDAHPYFYRTRDAGQTWQKIVAGLAERGIARTIREDPVRRGLLYAGTETGVYVSFDDGDHWQSLQLNLPTASVRDLAVHGDDLVAGTFGRGIWILDDLAPLRQASSEIAASSANLYQPAKALRVRWDNHQETPLPPEFPAGQNPPDGAIIDYYLKDAPAENITLEVRDARGELVRRFTSTAPAPDTIPGNAPDYWFAPPAVLPKKAGMNRFVWDLHYPNPAALPFSYYGGKLDYVEYTLVDHAILGQTPKQQPVGPVVAPGHYEIALEIGGKTFRQTLVVEMDPRIAVTQAQLEEQLALARRLVDWMGVTSAAYGKVTALRAAIQERRKTLAADGKAKDALDALVALDAEVGQSEDGSPKEPGFGPLNRDAARLFTMVEEGDLPPAESTKEAAGELCASFQKAVARWRKLNEESLAAANRLLEKYSSSPLPAAVPPPTPACGDVGTR